MRTSVIRIVMIGTAIMLAAACSAPPAAPRTLRTRDGAKASDCSGYSVQVGKDSTRGCQ